MSSANSPLIRVDETFSTAQRNTVNNWFSRILASRAGIPLVAEVARLTQNGAKPLVVRAPTKQERDNGTFRGLYVSGKNEIVVDFDQMSRSTPFTRNENGSRRTYEQTLTHELVHFLLDDNRGIRTALSGLNTPLGNVIGPTIEVALLQGRMTNEQAKALLSPMNGVIDLETQAERIANGFYNNIFEPIGLTDYYGTFEVTSGSLSFDYSKPIPDISSEDFFRLGTALRDASIDSLDSPKELYRRQSLIAQAI
jgi:hypothetical protein